MDSERQKQRLRDVFVNNFIPFLYGTALCLYKATCGTYYKDENHMSLYTQLISCVFLPNCNWICYDRFYRSHRKPPKITSSLAVARIIASSSSSFQQFTGKIPQWIIVSYRRWACARVPSRLDQKNGPLIPRFKAGRFSPSLAYNPFNNSVQWPLSSRVGRFQPKMCKGPFLESHVAPVRGRELKFCEKA